MGKTMFLSFYFGLVSIIISSQTNTDPAPGRSPGPPDLDSVHNIISETLSDNHLTNNLNDSVNIIYNSKSEYKSMYEKSKSISEKSTNKLPLQCSDKLSNIIKINETNKTYENLISSQLKDDEFNFEVTHNVFNTDKGLICGLIYKVRLEVTSPKFKSFVVQTVSYNKIPIGNFITYNLDSQLSLSRIHTKKLDNIIQEFKDNDNKCPNNFWTGDFYNKSESVAFWILNQFCDSLNATEFRIYLRLASNEDEVVLLKKTILIQQKNDCNLWLKNSTGIFDYTFLPINSIDCIIKFPLFEGISITQPPEYLIKLSRLNIPCDSGSYIQFKNQQKMCGKLEELSENELTLHFNIYEDISFRIFNNPVFSLEYNIVDYCYNTSVTEMNATYFIKPVRNSLECYIKIHLPYGNKINLTIVTNYANNEFFHDIDNIDFENVLKYNDFTNANLSNKLETNYNINQCNGILIKIIEVDYIVWHYCLQEENEYKKISYLSTSNVLAIYVKKYTIQKYDDVILNTKISPSILLTYKYEPISEIVENCSFGWITIQQFCVTIVETAMSWKDGEDYCATIGGHLASIRTESNQKVISELIKNSPKYQNYLAYWIGGSDKRFEGEYKWTDGIAFQYSNWFPGWGRHNYYNKQPNDDGLSNQDCIELRKYFRTPPGIHQSTSAPFSDSFMWNDRDCNAKNYIICQNEISNNFLKSSWTEDCNKTVTLTKESPKASIWSPLFPRQYPDNANCYTTITAPNGYKIVVEFEELVIESESGCTYDYLEITEPTGYQENQENEKYVSKVTKNISKWNNGKRNSYEQYTSGNNYELAQTNYQNLLNIFSVLYKPQLNYLIRTPNYPKGNILYQTNIPKENLPKKICGDWSSKLKLLRYVSRNSYLGFHFLSDYSHNFGGYKAKIFMENSESECPDDRLKPFNSSCYLFVSYPEVDWWTAQQICKGIGAQLTSVATSSEHRFVTTSIRNQADYTPQVLYWLGAELVHSGQFEWIDNTRMTFQGWLSGENKFDVSVTESTCLGIQWKKSPTPMLPSGLYWESEKCRTLGGYICKKKKPQYKYFELKNETISGTEGRLTSLGYPGLYPPNTDYWTHIVAPARSRIIVQFQKIDLEAQDECLYDFISIQNYDKESEIMLEPGSNIVPMAMLKSDGNMEDRKYENERMYFLRRARRSYSNKFKNNKQLLYMYKKFLKIKLRKKRSIEKRNTKRFLKHDLIEQFEQSSPSFLPYVRWCGQHDSNMTKFDFVSLSNEITINFHSDYSISGLGFAAIWKTIDMSSCPKQSLTSREGTISSPNYPHFLINNIDCTYVIQAPNGKRIWLQFKDFDILEETLVYIDIGSNVFQPYLKENHINDGIFVSLKEQIIIQIKTAQKPRGRGFHAVYKTVGNTIPESVIKFSNHSNGHLYRLNYPEKVPENITFSQHLIAPLGEIILLEIYDVEFSVKECVNNSKIEVFDYYADSNGTKWILCKSTNNQNNFMDKSSNFNQEIAPVHITSYLNSIHVIQVAPDNYFLNLNATVRIQEDINLKFKLTSGDELVESCLPDPCLHKGKCKTSGNKSRCQCYGHYTGRFCALNVCELEPCVYGKCELTTNNFKCHCQPGYIGLICDQKQNPCADNPCEGRGECFIKNGEFTCRCHAWWEGKKCERRMLHIPYKPLSERMLQEPFWLGLITVFVVLALIGLVWCGKRHFPEKIEKLLAEEADRNRPAGSVHGHHHTSLREQLQFTSAVPQSSAINLHGPSRSIFNKLGIRKPSLLSLSSPNPSAEATARTFSLDDLLQPLPRRSPSPRKKRNNSTPVKKNAAEKTQILQQLVSPNVTSSAPKLNLCELIQMSENNIKTGNIENLSSELKETMFLNTSVTNPRPILNDPKLEKKVTFARLLNKVSAEMSSGSDMDIGSSMKLLTGKSFPIDIHPNSVPPSPCTNEIRLSNITTSSHGSDSLSSSDIALTDVSFKNCNNSYKDGNNRKIRPKTSSADSILTMFRNFASTSGGINSLPTSSVFVSPASTPTRYSPQDDIAGDDDSSTSSMHTPVSFSSGPPDSPIFYRPTIEVPVVDIINNNKTAPSTNLLHPPSVLLEIPNNGINKCLSPIRELPTPIPSPALTPIMPRLHRSVALDKDSHPYENINLKNSTNAMITNYTVINHFDSEDALQPSVENYTFDTKRKMQTSKINSNISNSIIEKIPAEKNIRPRDLIIPTLLVEHPSPTKNSVPMILFPGSPPPQKTINNDETSFIFPKQQEQNRISKLLDKTASLDLSFVTPTITITSNVNGQKIDPNTIPSNIKFSGTENSTGMCYLSPFTMCTRADRTISESNLSSSGYSSMASPGPSRCSSSNPLYPNEIEEHTNMQSGSNNAFHISLLNRRQSSNLSFLKENNNNSYQNRSYGNIEQIRLRSDSETLSDDAILESNDEGIGTDHIDEKHEDISIKLITDETLPMAQLQLPLVTVQNEGNEKGISPVSSRSESPLSERAENCRFSSHFYGKKDQQLPFTDSDGLYDFPSSDGKGVSSSHPRRSSSKKRERKSSKTIPIQSPTKHNLVDGQIKDTFSKYSNSKYFHASHSNQAGNISTRKSPKKRQRLPVPSSSSSTESLTSARDLTIRISKRLQTSNSENFNKKNELKKSEDDTSQEVVSDIFGEQQVKPKSKSSRLKSISNQIRFLRRLEKSIKRRGQLLSSERTPDDENNDELNSLAVTYSLLRPKYETKLVEDPCQKYIANVSSSNYENSVTEENS